MHTPNNLPPACKVLLSKENDLQLLQSKALKLVWLKSDSDLKKGREQPFTSTPTPLNLMEGVFFVCGTVYDGLKRRTERRRRREGGEGVQPPQPEDVAVRVELVVALPGREGIYLIIWVTGFCLFCDILYGSLCTPTFSNVKSSKP